MVSTSSIRTRLQPYLPRLTLEWLETDPEQRHRAIDGSVVFVDISGFTKLSEKLAKAGRVGAEEMADAINRCFTELLTVAYEEDGSLVKFGGDALFLLFSGGEPVDHAARAVRAAAGMRRKLREVGKIATTRGTVGLRMSVGVHTGTFHFFLVGDSHRELFVTGPGATEVVQTEGTADAGEILLSRSTAELLPPRCLGASKGDGRLLRSPPAGEPPGLVALIPQVDDELVERCVPVAIREQLLAGTREPEHRQTSVAFLHFEGTDEVLHEQGAHAVAEALDELARDVQAAVDELQVSFLASDVDADGGKIILTAGVPRAVGEDEERMLLALRRIADGTRRLPLRIGVNHGGVFAGDVGPSYRRTYTVMGDTVNLAARVMSKAPPGEVYATESVIERSATRFEVSELEPFMVKGKAKPVQAWAIGQPIGSRARDDAPLRRLPLVGREDEMRNLQALADASRRGEGHLAEIVGEAGIGKTRLLEELREREGDLRSMHATAEAYTSSTPYATWRELLREFLEIGWEDHDHAAAERLRAAVQASCPELTPWLPLLADAIDADVPSTPEVDAIAPEFRRPKLHEVVGRFLQAAMATPTLIQIEDAHLMDPASAELLASLASSLEERPWLIAVARRDVGTGFSAPEGESVVRVDLPPLSADAARQMVLTATEDNPLLPHDEQLVASRSGGNPQFLLDLVQAVASGSMLPDSVEAAATARIDSLAPIDRTLVRRASVFGVSFHPRFLVDVLDQGSPKPDDQTWRRLAEVFEDDGDGYLRFRRAVVRDAAYEGLPFRTRRALHATVGARLERDAPDPEEASGLLSLHFFLAAQYEKAYGYARTAAQAAADRYANEEAAHLFRRAIDSARRISAGDDELGRLYESLSTALFAAGDFRKALDANGIASRYYRKDPRSLGRVFLQRSKLQERLGGFRGALRSATRARTVLLATPDVEAHSFAATVSGWYAGVLQGMGRTADSERWARRTIAEAEETNNRKAVAEAYDVLDTLNFTVGRPTGEYWQGALEIFEQIGDASGQQRVLANLGVGCFAEGRWDDAMSFYERSHDAAAQLGDVVNAAILEMNMAEIALERGSLEEAESLLRDALRVWRASAYRYMAASCLWYLGRVLARIGRIEDALELFRESHEGFEQSGASEEAIEVTARIAESYTFRQEPEAALDALDSIDATPEAIEAGMSGPLAFRVRGYALAQLGDLDGARIAFERSLAAARSRGAEFEVSQAVLALVRLYRAERIEVPPDLFAEGNEILERLRIGAVPLVPLPTA